MTLRPLHTHMIQIRENLLPSLAFSRSILLKSGDCNAMGDAKERQGRSCGLSVADKEIYRPHAEFLFVAEEELLETAKAGAIPFDAPRIPQVKLNHRGERCTFEAIIDDYNLGAPGLKRLALIVRAADVKGQEQVAPEGIGLRAIAHGLAAMNLSDRQ